MTMYLSLLLVLSISVSSQFAGTIPDDHDDRKQLSLLNVLSPRYHLDDDAFRKAVSESQLRLQDNSDAAVSNALGQLTRASWFKREHYHDDSGLVYTLKNHMDEITTLLASAPDFKWFIHRASILRNVINPCIYNFALKSTLFIREDLADLWYPPLWQINSRSFFTEEAMTYAAKQTPANAKNLDIAKFRAGTIADPEYRTAWFREDIGLNEMHAKLIALHAPGLGGHEDIFHMFVQILARYDAERFAVELPRVTEIKWTQGNDRAIAEGYDPHLSTNLGEKRFAARPSNMGFVDNLRDPDNPITMEHFTYLASKIVDNIRSGFMTNEHGEQVPMTKELLDGIMEGKSINKRLYTDRGIHKFGHWLLSVITDPDGRYEQQIGVLGIPEAAMRDPLFYRFHRFIYNFYDMHQMLLPAYSESDFEFSGLRVDEVKVQSIENPHQEGVLETFMEITEEHIMYDPTIENYKSKDSNTPLMIPHERLNHTDFEYLIKVHNSNPDEGDTMATIRIFIAPHNDETKMPFKSLNDQRRFFIEMDKFVTKLNKGDNFIKRSSVMSSVSFPSVNTYEQWRAFVNTHGLRRDRLTGCGWPAHLLLPRGTAKGMDFDLFVMVTDWKKDRAESVDPNTVPNLDFGSSICGVKGAPYPDKKSRGFPFDRKFKGYNVLTDFAEDYDNIFVGSLKVINKN